MPYLEMDNLKILHVYFAVSYDMSYDIGLSYCTVSLCHTRHKLTQVKNMTSVFLNSHPRRRPLCVAVMSYRFLLEHYYGVRWSELIHMTYENNT